MEESKPFAVLVDVSSSIKASLDLSSSPSKLGAFVVPRKKKKAKIIKVQKIAYRVEVFQDER